MNRPAVVPAAGGVRAALAALTAPGRLAFAVACLTLLALAWGFRRHVVDDAYISFRYADHVAAGLGYVFNPGERVEGASNLLWVLVLAALRGPGLDPVPAAQVLGVAAALATLFFQLGLSQRLGDLRPSAIGPWLTALNVPFALWAVAGLETAAYACALTAATLAAARDLESPRARWPATTLYLVVALLRPEGAMFAAPYLAIRVWRAWRGRSGWRDALLPVAILGVGIGAVTLWRWFTFHAVVPNTFFAKVDWGASWSAERGLRYLWRWAVTGAGLAVPLALLTLIRRTAPLTVGEGLTWAPIVLQAGFVVAVRGDWMPAARFVMPVLPLLHVLAGGGVRRAWEGLRVRLAAPMPMRGVAILAAALTLAACVATANQHRRDLEPYVIGVAQGHESLGRWLRRAAPRDARLALSDCGAVPYFSGLRTLDLIGLTDAFAARHGPVANARRIVHEVRPELVVLAFRPLPGPPPALRALFAGDRAVARDPAFVSGWAPVARWPFVPGNYDLYLFARRDVRLREPPP